MSTILKALRRLESERATPTDGRPLREAVAAAEPLLRPSQRRRWMPLVSLVVGVAVGATVLLLWPRGEPSPPAEVQSPELAASPPTRSSVRAPRSAPLAPPPAREDRPPSPVGLPSEAFASDVAVVPRPVPSPRLADPHATELGLAAGAQEQSAALSGTGDSPEPTTGAQPVIAPPPRNLARVEPEPAGTPAVPEERAADSVDERSATPTEAPVAPAPARTEGVVTGTSARPSATEPSQIRVEKTLWHPVAGRRVAVVTLPDHEGPLRVREGEVVGEVLVSKIEPSGVVFTGDQGEVRRTVGAP